jgi:hypothetical protein
MVIQTTYTQTDPISFVSAPNLLHFRSKSTIRYIRFQIHILLLSAPLQIRWKNIVEDMVKAKSNPIQSVYFSTQKYESNIETQMKKKNRILLGL